MTATDRPSPYLTFQLLIVTNRYLNEIHFLGLFHLTEILPNSFPELILSLLIGANSCSNIASNLVGG